LINYTLIISEQSKTNFNQDIVNGNKYLLRYIVPITKLEYAAISKEKDITGPPKNYLSTRFATMD